MLSLAVGIGIVVGWVARGGGGNPLIDGSEKGAEVLPDLWVQRQAIAEAVTRTCRNPFGRKRRR